jgi:cytochrome P450
LSGTKAVELYYDPYDSDIDDNPYPVWKRMREEAPLYYNEKYNFYALSRYEDVARELPNWQTYRSGRGTTADILFNNIEVPPGILLFEDPPLHDLHRRLLSRVFTPRRMLAVESLVREFCTKELDPLIGTGGFDFIADLGAMMPMRTIGYLLGIPEEHQERIRDRNATFIDTAKGREPGDVSQKIFEETIVMFAEFIEWRAEHPSDDLMTELLAAEIDEPDGKHRPLSRTEVLSYTAMIAGAGNETTARLIGFMGQLLSDHPDQRRELVADPSLIPGAVEETLRYEPPSPVQARYVAQRFCQPRRTSIPRSGPLRHPSSRQPPELWARTALLPRLGTGPVGSPGGVRRGPQTLAGLGSRLCQRRTSAHRECARVGTPAGRHWLVCRRQRRPWRER